ncbi:MAG: SDR family oxidoreductase [Proteobacteria bacterium]|nr:SDR family oxidoreductase [Burkholderiales bacterium]
MNLQLENFTALVSGSTAGIGFAIAKALAAEGVKVAVNGRTAARVERALAEIRAQTPNAKLVAHVADLTRADEARRTLSLLPELDLLINNLGVYRPRPFADIDDAQWAEMIDTNFMSGLRLARGYLPGMIARNRGRIVFIASESGVDVPAEMIHYGVTKTMQIALARGLAKLTAGTAVTVNSVLAGPTYSEGVQNFIGAMATERGSDAQTIEREFFQNVRPQSLLKRFIAPEEIAAMVAYLCSPLAAATNGAALRVEGGIVNAIL